MLEMCVLTQRVSSDGELQIMFFVAAAADRNPDADVLKKHSATLHVSIYMSQARSRSSSRSTSCSTSMRPLRRAPRFGGARGFLNGGAATAAAAADDEAGALLFLL
jgi:hypothetical protein